MLFESLCTVMYYNVSSVDLKENKKKFRNSRHFYKNIYVAYKTVGLSSCRTIELLD